MSFTLNGETRPTGTGCSLREVVAELTGRDLTDAGQPADGQRLGIAVAVNAEVVPRSRWATVRIDDGDDVEVVNAVQGG
ncbi:thiamine biosynthesis protein ThiS [Arthrobacter sp. RIT-PI-e]|uniref:sulfur carrier protein ThiS n=1 Tax=Arthrobacter sp. RIT-PI-e TaxID=1681197 RepID=UPI0006765243|nr:sulfur carrier protein ThiS [Arthrobacter sp. RIT-PI-e]KNC20357.1 thiamine biosynthesis protein ThiS [Arthrobacter sp. RIT-PI-e]